MKRIQKRYKTEEQIPELIDETRKVATAEYLEAESYNQQADIIKAWLQKRPWPWEELNKRSKEEQSEYGDKTHQLKSFRAKSDKLKKHQGTLSRRLETLGEKLSAFRTEPMPFLPDRSVV